MSTPQQPPEFTEEELRQLEAELDRLQVDDVLLQTLVTLINLGARKAGLASPPGADVKRDLDQTKQAIDGARALLPLVEARHAEALGPVKDMLSQLQMAYVQLAGPAASEPASPEAKPDGPGPAQSSGRLWVPGQ